MSDLLEAAIKVLEYVKLEVLHYTDTGETFLQVELDTRAGCTYKRVIAENSTGGGLEYALADLSAAVDAQIEADTARDMEHERQREYLERLELQWKDAPPESGKSEVLARLLHVNTAAGEGD